MNFFYPLRGTYTITQTFQEHVDYAKANGLKYNGGIDWACFIGTPVYASMAGKVSCLSDPKGYGNPYIKQTNDIWTVVYGHLSECLIENGQTVEAGDLIGKSGSTGNSTGPHLHFEIRKNNTPVDPMPLLIDGVPVDGEPAELVVPELPTPVMAEIIVKGPLNIRNYAISGKRVGSLYQGDKVPVIASTKDRGNIWLQIGYGQWIAGFFDGEPYVKFI